MSTGSIFLIICPKLRNPRHRFASEATAIYSVIGLLKKSI